MKLLIAAIAAFALTGCATQSKTRAPSGPTGFETLAGGETYHPGTGLVCPAEVNAGVISGQREYGTKGRDASCSYDTERGLFTVYLTESEASFRDNFGGAAAAVLQGNFGDRLSYDAQASTTCTLSGLMLAAADVDDGQSKSGSFTYETALFTGTDIRSLLAMSEIDGMYLKLRMTEFDEPELMQSVSDTGQGSDNSILFCVSGGQALREVYNATLAAQ